MNGRNQPCQCGSGIKSKRCCETPAKQAARKQAENEAFRAAILKQREEFLEKNKNLTKTLPINRRRLSSFAAMVPLMLAMGMHDRIGRI